MNRSDVITKIAENTGISHDTVDAVVKISEEFGGLTLIRKAHFKENNKASLLDEIAELSGNSRAVCETILDEFSNIFRKGLTDKLTFKK